MTSINSWRVMWVLVAFDTPTKTMQQRRDYTRFRKHLLQLNFMQFQFSVYLRHCATIESAHVLVDNIKKTVPSAGHIVCFYLTDKQYGMTREFFGSKSVQKRPEKPPQLELF